MPHRSAVASGAGYSEAAGSVTAKRRRADADSAMADAFAREITLALAEPEAAAPLPIDWDAYVRGGKDYGTKPLSLPRKKSGTTAAARARA